jgi:hypothetical protein
MSAFNRLRRLLIVIHCVEVGERRPERVWSQSVTFYMCISDPFIRSGVGQLTSRRRETNIMRV